MTTKTGARIYRGPSRDPLAEGACPHCFRVVSVTRSGRRRRHRDREGLPCTGSGVTVGASDEFMFTDLPDVQFRPDTADRTRYGRDTCGECGRVMPLNGDGTMRRHKAWADDPLAPNCEATP